MKPEKHLTSETSLFIITYHVALAIGLPIYFYYRTPSWGLVGVSIALLFLTEIGIGAAYHRFYSHRAYSMKRPAEAVLLFLSTAAFQGSVVRWSHDHRLHHAHVDTDDDPYSIHRGFWYAHMWWLFDRSKPIDESNVSDLMKNKLVTFQYRHYGILSFGTNILLWLAVGWWFKDFLGAFVLTWWTRLFLSHHLTWFINSLAHYWGERTYSKEHSAVDNYILAFLTVGEGYHNYHHTFASDYRNGVRWYHFDPVKWTIFTLSKLGQTSELRRYNSFAIKRKLLFADRDMFLGRLSELGANARPELEAKVRELAATIQEKMERMRALVAEIKRHKVESARAAMEKARAELRELHRSLRRDWKSWSQLGEMVLSPSAAAA